MNDADDLFQFAEEEPQYERGKSYWKVLIIDDEWEMHEITKVALEDFEFDHKKLFFISAYSSNEAEQILSHEQDIALILLDITLENETSGLKLVEYVRKKLSNFYTRIIIRTGRTQDLAMQRRMITDYDFNDYQNNLRGICYRLRACAPIKTSNSFAV